MGMLLDKRQQLESALLSRLRLPTRLLLVLGLVLLGGSLSFAQEAVLEAVDINDLAGGGVQLRFRLSQPPAAPPNSFTINDPARVVLDFPNVRNGLSRRRQNIDSGVAESISVLQGEDRTRASINLSQLVPYTLRTEGNAVVLTLEADAPTMATVGPAAAATAVPGTVPNVDFRRNLAGGAVITFTLSDPAIPVDVRQEGNRIIADIQGATLPRGQQRRLDVTDFGTLVSQVDALNRGENARIVIEPEQPFEYLAYQADENFTIEVNPLQEEPLDDELDFNRRVFTGELLSLNFQDIDVRAVLQIIADFTGQNVVVSDTVQGNLTLRLQNVPWDQALSIILRTKGLTMRQNGNVMYIAPTEEVAARERLELEARRTVTELVPLRSELIQINYAKASDLAEILVDTADGDGEEASLLSPRGQVTVDDRTNSLLIQDIPDKIDEIRALIVQLDRPVRQVLIDSRVVIATDDFRKEIGVRWGFTGVDDNDGDGIITATGSLDGTAGIVDDAVNNLQDGGSPFPVSLPDINDRLGVNLGVADPFGSLALAILGEDYLVDLELSALQAEGRGEVLSNPRVVTADRAEASIRQGREIPYQTISEDGINIEFRSAELELTVVPQITPDNRVIMDLAVRKNEQGPSVSSSTGALIPTIETREIITQVLVDNGQTVVLGGVFEQTTNNNVDKVPLLGDIPALGRLFQRRINADVKRELLIFVTPQIVQDNITDLR